MNQYFKSESSGLRYHQYRPKVHDTAIEWLELHCPNKIFGRSIDIACGTGDSLKPLLRISDDAMGIDISDEMLSVARAQKLPVVRCDYKNIAQLGSFDLLSTCMAFHWFDPDIAIESYKAASNPDAVWLIYNFALVGHETSNVFNDWYLNRYLDKYPAPPRNNYEPVDLEKDETLRLLGKDRGWLPVLFDSESLAGYLCTQSNVEQRINEGCSQEEIFSELKSEISVMDIKGNFKYHFTYEIHQVIKD